MHTGTAEISRLSLLVQRMLDADLLLEEQGAALLAESDAARRSLEAGDTTATRRHIERLAQFTEALVEANALAREDVQPVLGFTDCILNPEAGADA